MRRITHYQQLDAMDCGPICLKIIAKYYGKAYSTTFLRSICEINRGGVSLLGISKGAEKIGFRSLGVEIDTQTLEKAPIPMILHWNERHFVVLYSQKNSKYKIADPAVGLVKVTKEELCKNWTSAPGHDKGFALLLSPTPTFFLAETDHANPKLWLFLLAYLKPYKSLALQLILSLIIGSLMQILIPFMTQSIVDIGINTKNLNFVSLLIIAQAILIVGRVSNEYIRSWILLHITTRVNISILTDFLIKVMKLPISFFDTKLTGDIMTRMEDQRRIENFLTTSTLSTIFSFVSLITFFAILIHYSAIIFVVYFSGAIITSIWVLLFLKSRRSLNYKSFHLATQNQTYIVQLVRGMQDIKLNNCEQQKQWEWERIQSSLFKFNIKNLSLSQYQQGGSLIATEMITLFILYLSASAVISGQLTFGAMLAIQYMVGQLNNPIQQLLGFSQSYQDAKISLERLHEVHKMDEEEVDNQDMTETMPVNKSIILDNVSFAYPGFGSDPVLKDINLLIPQGKITAIVGLSGSGKTTLIKILLRFYSIQSGSIRIGSQNLSQFKQSFWRAICGSVMQDGYIFPDTIAKNIAVSDETVEPNRLMEAIKLANMEEFIDSLPLGVNTHIGDEGNNISQGQKQRILIARAVYKNPEYLFFDEATNSLDAENELIIMNNLNLFFRGKTVVIVAHRLSTVTNADNIIVLEKGAVIELDLTINLLSRKDAIINLSETNWNWGYKMLKKDQRHTRHSSNIEHIISSAPSFGVRWGITIIFLALVGILVLTSLISYPDILYAPITIKTTLETKATNAPVSKDLRNFYAQISLPPEDTGKIAPGQIVQITLKSFPSEKYGYLEGKIGSILKNADHYNRISVTIEILAPKSGKSKNKIYLQNEMTTEARIFTNRTSVLQQICRSVFSEFRNK